MLIGGGVAVAVSLAVLGYYGMMLVEALESDAKYSVDPGGSIELMQNLSAVGQGAYIAAFPQLDAAKPIIVIRDPSDVIVRQNTVDQLIVLEAFPVAQSGVFTLNLTNPSSNAVEAAVIMDSQEAVLSRAGALSPIITVAFGFMLVAGAGALIAGALITIVDRRRLTKMKQYGDTSDLV